MNLEKYQENFKIAEANFDKNPNAKTAEKLQNARNLLERFIADNTPISEEQRNFEKEQLKELIELVRVVRLSL